MRILVVTLYYSPDGGPAAPLYAMLCEELARRGHQVTVLTSVPHYPTGRVRPEYRRHTLQRSLERGVQVIRVPVPSVQRARLPQRLLQFACYQLGAAWAGLSERYDAVLLGNPALAVGLPFALLATLRRKPAIYSVHDVYPDVGVALGVFRHRAVITAVGALERFCLRRAAWVRVLSESFRPGVAAQGVPASKMALVYDWVDTDLIRPLPRDNDYARENGLDGCFVALYAGNIGLSQGLEHVLSAAAQLAGHEDMRFVFVGDGTGRASLQAEAQSRRLANVRFLPFQPRARLPEVLATADVSLVPLQKGVALRSLPSKIFSILASGRPLLASLDEGSDAWQLVQRAQAGLCVPPESPEELAGAILALRSDPDLCARLGRNGRDYALRHHSPQSAAEQFEQLFASAIPGQASPHADEDTHRRGAEDAEGSSRASAPSAPLR
ncbi:MAG TPA: glycosyltransferase family 4 protein [Anaerolineae bacterium]|nr:glycosyltransferase family 4 protein [Anaerolineae bacterium]HOR00746.1 glycosyltransferase family 4 protein [Anaerolineae bacterium]HPL27249.1 glycosyltransferase family 4 protein [Anaerolineae bacterium]